MPKVWAEDFTHVYDPSVGEDGPWYINDHTFVRDHAGLWHLIGITHAEPMHPFDELHLAHATAPSLLGPWTKHPFALSTEAALGETQLWAPHVVRHDDRYWMYVCAGGADKRRYRIHLATSDDCWTWVRHPDNPMVVDGWEARDPMVVRVGERWVMYYTATDPAEGGNHVVAAATSDDLVHWSGRTVVFRDAMVGTGAGPTESPFVIEHGGRWYLLIGPDHAGLVAAFAEVGEISKPDDIAAALRDMPAYRRTRVLVSDDPMHFDATAQVGTIDAHAAEVIVGDDGQLWVSHCGWGQGGVHVARLHIDP